MFVIFCRALVLFAFVCLFGFGYAAYNGEYDLKKVNTFFVSYGSKPVSEEVGEKRRSKNGEGSSQGGGGVRLH